MKDGTLTICLRTLQGEEGGGRGGRNVLEHRIVNQFMCGYSPNVSLLYKHPSVVDTLGQPQFEHLCLQPSL